MVGCKLQLDAVFAEGAFLDTHYSSAVDDDINGWYIGQFFGCLANGFLAGQVDLEKTVFDVREFRLESIDAVLDFDWATSC